LPKGLTDWKNGSEHRFADLQSQTMLEKPKNRIHIGGRALKTESQKSNTNNQEPAIKPTAPSGTTKSIAFSGWPMILAWLGMFIFALHACMHMVGAGDTWVALACGRHFINHGVDTVEPFSANSHKAGPTLEEVKNWPEWAQWITSKVGIENLRYCPKWVSRLTSGLPKWLQWPSGWHPTGWIDQNWLTHVMFYWLSSLSPFKDADNWCFNTLVYWKFALYIITVICVYYIGRFIGVNPALSAVFACFAMFTGRSYLDIRPAGFSNLLVGVFLLILVLATYRNILYIWLIVPMVVFWCNAHGGYIYAFIMLVPFVALNFLTSFFPKRFVSIGRKGVYHTAAAGLVAFVAMVIFNPFHLTNLTHTFIISVSKAAERWRTVNEWHPAFEWDNPVGTGFPFLVLYVLSIGLLVLWLVSRFLKPRLLKMPKNEFEAQKKRFTTLSEALGCAAAVLIGLVVFISFSFLNLDAGSFFICTIFVAIVLLSVRKSVHFIYFTIPLTLLALLSSDASVGFVSRYIYPFVLLPAYVITHIIASLLSKAVKPKPKNIIFVAATSVATLILMTVLFNPFNFSLPVWHLEQFLNLHRMWQPDYERTPTLSYTHLFSILYIINIALALVWLSLPRLLEPLAEPPQTQARQAHPKTDDTYEVPKIDLALIAIAALTIYMAIRSRRFIPIAAIAACPLAAMFIDQMIQTISAARNFHRNNRFVVSPMPYFLQLFFIFVGAAVVLGLGTWWTLKFKRVYLDPWYNDPRLTSVFIRMTASDAKPFYACRFIKDNKLRGKMFNYWTEGGFIAWGQDPDPNTGKTPLQLFMDGRAQAAYDRSAYDIWADIMFGGPSVQQAMIRKERFNYAEIGEWISTELRKYNVWVVLMPIGVNTDTFVTAFEHNRDWPIVFLDDRQKLFIDTKTTQGREFFETMVQDKAIYSDEFSKNLTMAHNLLLLGNGAPAYRKGLEAAIRALELRPSVTPMLEIVFAGQRSAELSPIVYSSLSSYADDFRKNKGTYAKQNGYIHRLIAARMANEYLRQSSETAKDTKLAQSYNAKVRDYDEEIRQLQEIQTW
jgi:hypothetical protein